MNHTLSVILGILLITLVAGVFNLKPSPGVQNPPVVKAGDLTMKECSIKLGSGKYAADCGALIVPENRSKKDSRLISLPVIRIRATGKNPAEPIFYLEGGPGMSNMHAQPPAGLLSTHDFIMIGYRGVDGSVKLNCPELSGPIKGDGKDVLSQPSLLKVSAALARCAQRYQHGGASRDGKVSWPTQRIPQEFHQAQPSDVETLLVSGCVDFSTPAKYATEELLPHLTHGKQIILSEMGHVSDMLTLQPKAAERLLVSLFDTGAADDSLFKHQPMDFKVKVGFPLIAKISLVAAALILPAVIFGVWFLVRRIGGREA